MIEAAGSGVKLTMRITIPGQGTDGKPSGETMAIRGVDDRHSTNVIKNGPIVVNQKSEVSADGKPITTESTPVSPQGRKPSNIGTRSSPGL